MLRLFRRPLTSESPFPASRTLLEDLELAEYLGQFFADPMRYVTGDAEAIRERQEVCKALLENEPLAAALHRLYGACLPFLAAPASSPGSGESLQAFGTLKAIRELWDAANGAAAAVRSCGPLPPALAIGGLNGIPFGSMFAAMHADAAGGERRYRIREGLPQACSGAEELYRTMG